MKSVSILPLTPKKSGFDPRKCLSGPRKACLSIAITVIWRGNGGTELVSVMNALSLKPQWKRHRGSCSWRKGKETQLKVRSVFSLRFLNSSSRSVTCILFSTYSATAMKPNITGSVCSHQKMSSTAHKNLAIYQHCRRSLLPPYSICSSMM